MSARYGRVAGVTENNQAVEENTPPPWTQAPSGWPVPSENLTEQARQVVLSALAVDGMHPADERLVRDAETNAALLLSGPPDDVTTADLLDVALQVPLPPVAARRLLVHGGHRLEVLAALTDLQDDDLVLAGPSALLAMEHLLAVIGDVLSPGDAPKALDGFIGAEFLCARKRPGLFPALNGLVRAALGLSGEQHRRVDWLLFRALLGDREVMSAVDDLSDRVRSDTRPMVESVGPERLQILCAALNTQFTAGAPQAL
jgi:Family of unknown function (DUF6308)